MPLHYVKLDSVEGGTLELHSVEGEDNQRWWQVHNPMLSGRQHIPVSRGIHAFWELTYSMKKLTQMIGLVFIGV